jgi:uncharacterized protein with beta-barrel porin domain
MEGYMASKLSYVRHLISVGIIAGVICYSSNTQAIAYIPGGKDFISNRLVLGNELIGVGVSFDSFLNIAERRNRTAVMGYKITTTGVMCGADYNVTDTFVVGAALTYAKSNVRTNHTLRDTNKVDTYKGIILFSFMPGHTFLDIYLSSGRNKYKITRNVVATSEKALGKTNANQSGMRAVIGHNILGNFDSSSSFAPVFSINYVGLDGYTYTESGTLDNNQVVVKPKTRKIELGLGVEAASEFNGEYSKFIPQLHFMFLRDSANTRHNSIANFTLAEGGFKSLDAPPKRISYNLGLAFTLSSNERLFITGAYDFALQSRYKSHTAGFKFKYVF